MNKLIAPIIVLVAIALSGCGLLTPAVDQSLNKSGIAILCSLEEEELADPALNEDCDKLSAGLTAGQRAAVARHAAHARAVRASMSDSANRAEKSLDSDGGVQ